MEADIPANRCPNDYQSITQGNTILVYEVLKLIKKTIWVILLKIQFNYTH